jgi:serine/threonine-protein kinase 11
MDRKKECKMCQQYAMGEVLGEGSQGKVREALDSVTLRRVAIKIVNLRVLRTVRNAEENLRRELRIHRRLKHANVVELIEDFKLLTDEKHKWYIVMELVMGGSLQDICDAAPGHVLPDSLTCRFTRQLLGGLEHCHSRGVVHRDIKPSNLMVSTDGVLKICDFGVADELDNYAEGDLTCKFRGSPAFQPPEVARGGEEEFSGCLVDVWAVGVCVFLMATGRAPFEGSTLMNLFANIEKGEYTIPPRIEANAPLGHMLRGLLHLEQAPQHSMPHHDACALT